ncbi:MAG: DsrE family protein [Deltaproteobacteria bacterium]|nr:DsrE family protein [Deltaproteobacteria bacterium]
MESATHKVIVGVLNPGESPADNGRMVHALQLAKRLVDSGAEVEVVFEGKAVTWLPRLTQRTEDSHPFDKHYGPVFDSIRHRVRACNMCCKRFDATEAVAAADIPIVGQGQDHIDIARYVLEGYQVINH